MSPLLRIVPFLFLPALLLSQDKIQAPLEGKASFYADKFEGRKTANGEIFNNSDFTAAHRNLPFNSLVRITNPDNNKTIVVRINDRGPFKKGRIVDLTRSAAKKIGLDIQGETKVIVQYVTTTLLTRELDSVFRAIHFADCLGNMVSLSDYTLVLWRTNNLQHMLHMANDLDDLEQPGKVVIERKNNLFYLLITGYAQKNQALEAILKLKSQGFFKTRIYN